MSALPGTESRYRLSAMNVFLAADGSSFVYLTGGSRAMILDTSLIRASRAINYPATGELLREWVANSGQGSEAPASAVRDGLLSGAEFLQVAEP
jgi:hypothetical protein